MSHLVAVRQAFSRNVGSCRFHAPLAATRCFGDAGTTTPVESEGRKKRPKSDPALFREEVKIFMPDVGAGGKGKVLKWYFSKGDLVKRNDILCDIEMEDFSFGMVTDDECDAMMGDILVEAESEPVEVQSVICTMFHPGSASSDDDNNK